MPFLTKTGRRACLSLGALAKTLHKTNASHSERLVKRIEAWLEVYNDTRSNDIMKLRKKRSVLEYDLISRKHIETKTALIHSLGNAAKQSSLNILKSYMDPSVKISPWRRAAVKSLRHFKCEDSATALLNSAVNDESAVVRQVAVKVFEKHPKGSSISTDRENIILSKNYTYLTVARIRRDIFQILSDGISVHIEPPGIVWEKSIGTSDIGAGFGLTIRNILDLQLGLLSGQFMVDVYDGAYAEVHVGLLNFHTDIIRAYVCFKGHVRYNLNILKDFGINSLQDLLHIFDRVIAKISDPIADALNDFKKALYLARGGIEKVINDIITVVNEMPLVVSDINKKLREFEKDINSLHGSEIVGDIRLITRQLRQLTDSVQQDVLKSYLDIADMITLELPYTGKRITEGFSLVFGAFNVLKDNPSQAVAELFRGLSQIKLGIAMLLDIKLQLTIAFPFDTGHTTEWLSTAKEFPKIIRRLREAVVRFILPGGQNSSLSTSIDMAFSYGVKSTEVCLQEVKNIIRSKFEQLSISFEGLELEIIRSFLKAFKALLDIIRGLKLAYKKLKDAIEAARALVQKVFGPKFHPKFPAERRKATGNLPAGVWPSTAGNYFETIGVDLVLGVGQTIVAPTEGIVTDVQPSRVIIQPTAPEFRSLEIVIENMEAVTDALGKHFNAGEKIGKATKFPGSTPNFIHLSMRKVDTDVTMDGNYDYIDPTTYLDRLIPVPKWIQECNDHEFSYIGNIFDIGEMWNRLLDEIKRVLDRKLVISLPSFDLSPIQITFGKLPDGGLPGFKGDIQFPKIGPFNFPKIGPFNFFNNITVEWTLGLLNIDLNLFVDLKNIIQSLGKCLTELPSGGFTDIKLPFITRMMSPSVNSSFGGAMVELSEAFINSATKDCPFLTNAIEPGYGHFCLSSCDCLGLVCHVALQNGCKINYLTINVSVNADMDRITIQYNNQIYTVDADGNDFDLNLETDGNGMTTALFGKLTKEKDWLTPENDVFSLTLDAKLCLPALLTCLAPVKILKNARFPLQKRSECISFGTDLMLTETIEEIYKMKIPAFLINLGECGLLSKATLDVLTNVRQMLVKKLLDEPPEKLGEIIKELKDELDYCVDEKIHVPNFDIPFFSLRTFFMVGPIPLSLGFGGGGVIGLDVKLGFCVLSMTAKVNLIPKVTGKVWGEAAVDIGFARGGIRLVGYLLETRFPIQTELLFSKYPLDVGSRMDLVLTPVRLELKAFAEVFLLFTTVTVFEGTLWRYEVPSINQNIFIKTKRDEDKSPPEIMPNTINRRRKRNNQNGCIVEQVPDRPYYDAAYRMEFHAEDSVSDTKLSYTIGSTRGGNDVVDWTEMGGPSLLVPAKLPGGIPLYWTFKAKNSQGLEAITQCALNTFDSTIPDGRVEHAYKYSSHPSKLISSIVVFEDSLLGQLNYKAVGYSQGQHGAQFVDWQKLDLSHSTERQGVSGSLKLFSVPRPGKLVAAILKSQRTVKAEDCATRCINYGTHCVSFDFEEHSETCVFHDVVQGANAYLRLSGTYSNYERLGVGYHAAIDYKDLKLEHGTLYFINAHIQNILGYDAYLVGEGTMIDFSPPEPGPIGQAKQDIFRADNCTASILQRCTDVTWLENHRVIIDGPGARTVFNGLRPLFDDRYTLTNHYVTANWDGFHDDESGIMGYTWAVGHKICGTEVFGFTDPFAHIAEKTSWTNSAFQKGFHLEDGLYYVTVQALNGVEFGGSLVTTVCHSIPFTVDTSPPVFSGVTDIIYDEDFDLIAIYYDANDELSQIARVEFGLGKTKYDVQLKRYSVHTAVERVEPFLSMKDLGFQEGIPAWIRVRVTNNVDLFTTGHGDEPILIDKSPPIAGIVLDGNKLLTDLEFQSSKNHICAQWMNFYDPESGIDRYEWGVGTKPLLDDVVQFINLTKYEKFGCASTSLNHNSTYYSTVFAYNNALNSKATNGSSNGVLVDVTPPIPGIVYDGNTAGIDEKYTSESATKACQWNGFYDLESDIDNFIIEVYVNDILKNRFNNGRKQTFIDKTIALRNKDMFYFKVYGINGAGLNAAAESNGVIVDHTPPVMTELSDTDSAFPYQVNDRKLNLRWNFHDDESGIKEYRTVIYETYSGSKQKFWPTNSAYNSTISVQGTLPRTQLTLDDLVLQNGRKYSLHITAINGARLSANHETLGVTVDTTPPEPPKVHIGLSTEEEDLNENGEINHSDQTSIRVSWNGRDSESGIKSFFVAVGTSENEESMYQFFNYGSQTTAYIENVFFKTTNESGKTYIVSVYAINGVGLQSPTGRSKPINILKADVPGIVFDGRSLFQDQSYSSDRMSIAASFYGFESESCSITGYEWAVGTKPYGTDQLSYTTIGLVMINETHGQMELNIELKDSEQYYASIRAVTGCKGQYILASSDGIHILTDVPEISFEHIHNNVEQSQMFSGTLYQTNLDSLSIRPVVNDQLNFESLKFTLGSLPFASDLMNFSTAHINFDNVVTLVPGQSTFITTIVFGKTGFSDISYSVPIIGDVSPPELKDLHCTKYLSLREPRFHCNWVIMERESIVDNVRITIFSHTDRQSSDKVFDIKHSVLENTFSADLKKTLKQIVNITVLIVNINVTNILGMFSVYEIETLVDTTPPRIENVQVVTRTNRDQTFDLKLCQEPFNYAEVRLISCTDEDSGINKERFKIAIGTWPYGVDIQDYVNIHFGDDGISFIDNLKLQSGHMFYVTVRCFNLAGLYTDAVSNGVVVSQNPALTVTDGPDADDSDYQFSINLVEGHWSYGDNCPVTRAEWEVSDSQGNIIRPFIPIPGAQNTFYDDGVSLINGVKYLVTVKTVDKLNRTRLSRSDGFTVRIQPPLPGKVRDGIENDINYQLSTSTLFANWDPFGDSFFADPTQEIHHYEVAVGNDRRYSTTRTNVYPFTNVGLNLSHAFNDLNLTAKLEHYYITVRAYNYAGGHVESYSNGIRVGFDEKIIAGRITSDMYQHSTSKITFSWGGFQSDIGIVSYQAGVSSSKPSVIPFNKTFECSTLEEYKQIFDIVPLTNEKLNEVLERTDLDLIHGHSYYPSVIVADESGMCSLTTGLPIGVDETNPTLGILYINGLECNSIVFAKSYSEMHVSWRSFEDPESNIARTTVTIFNCGLCNDTFLDNCMRLASETATNTTYVTFFELDLYPKTRYRITITVTNGAGMSTLSGCQNIFLDTTPPEPGVIKITDDWSKTESFQFNTNAIVGKLPIVISDKYYRCTDQIKIFPSKDSLEWMTPSVEFTNDFVVLNDSGGYLGLGYNSDLSFLVKSCIVSSTRTLATGNYTFKFTAAKGYKVISTFSLASTVEVIPTSLINKPSEEPFNESQFSNISGIRREGTGKTSTASTKLFETTATATEPPHLQNESDALNNTVFPTKEFGIGIHILGYTIDKTSAYYGLFWARTSFVSAERWFRLDFDPTGQMHTYIFNIKQQTVNQEQMTDVNLIIDNIQTVEIAGLQVKRDIQVILLTWNEDDFQPPIDDVFNPFYTESVVQYIAVPQAVKKDCSYGTAFYDRESAIKEIWVGVSDSKLTMDSVSKLKQFLKFCFPCEQTCHSLCNMNCTDIWLNDAFTLLDLNVTQLDLMATKPDSLCLNATADMDCNSTAYYLTAKIINFAGLSTYVHSNAIQIDTTPPSCEYMKCLDPEYSEDEPTIYSGSSSAIGAYWKCSEDVSLIQYYLVRVTSNESNVTLVNWTNVGLQTKKFFYLENGTFLNNEDYFVQTTVYNSAGLSASYICSIRVQLYPPDVELIDSKPMFSIEMDITLSTTEQQTNIGIEWSGGNSEVEYYEWKLGTLPESEDLFPATKVGVNKTGSAAIIQGHLMLNNETITKPVSEFKEINGTLIGNDQEMSEQEKAFFFVEPGRCIYHTLNAIGWSHLKRRIRTHAVCVKRPQDILGNAYARQRQLIISKEKSLEKWQKGLASQHDIIIEVTNFDGNIMIGSLSTKDKLSPYGSAATTDFKPYITDPDITRLRTSRYLRNRLQVFCNMSFFVSSTSADSHATLIVEATLPKTCGNEHETEPALVFWHSTKEQWEHTNEYCGGRNMSGTVDGRIYTFKLCPNMKTGIPRHFELVQILTGFQNHPPRIVTSEVVAYEDKAVKTTIEVKDSEDDRVSFEVIRAPNHANCSLNNYGLLECSLQKDYFGSDDLVIKVKEVQTLPEFSSLYVEKVVQLTVLPQPDKTERFFFDWAGHMYESEANHPTMLISFQLDANRTSSFNAGTLVLADVDGNETFYYDNLIRYTALGSSTYVIEETSLSDNQTDQVMTTPFRTLKAFNLIFKFSPELNGRMSLSFIALTSDGTYTPSLTIDLYILKNPCLDGVCNHSTSGIAGCTSLSRLLTFDDFACICNAGFTDQWCQTEINECLPEPCKGLYDCRDLVNGYRCELNIPKVLAIVFSTAVLATAVIGAVLLYLKNKRKATYDVPEGRRERVFWVFLAQTNGRIQDLCSRFCDIRKRLFRSQNTARSLKTEKSDDVELIFKHSITPSDCVMERNVVDSAETSVMIEPQSPGIKVNEGTEHSYENKVFSMSATTDDVGSELDVPSLDENQLENNLSMPSIGGSKDKVQELADELPENILTETSLTSAPAVLFSDDTEEIDPGTENEMFRPFEGCRTDINQETTASPIHVSSTDNGEDTDCFDEID